MELRIRRYITALILVAVCTLAVASDIPVSDGDRHTRDLIAQYLSWYGFSREHWYALTEGADTTLHLHDGSYYRKNEYVSFSAGTDDAGKPIVLGSAGYIDGSMVSAGGVDHGSLGGLGNDDHSQYYNIARLNAWTGSAAIQTVGTVSNGTWEATPLSNDYIAGAPGWNAAWTHQTREDAVNGLILGAGDGTYSAVANNSAGWNTAWTHQTEEDAVTGLVKCDGSGNYSGITDSSTNWDTAYTHSQIVTGNPHAIDITDLSSYAHNSLTGLEGGWQDHYYHLSAPEHGRISMWDDAALHVGSTGATHLYIDQDVTSGSAPTFTADNFSDGGSNVIITTTQETNFEDAYTHSQRTDHAYQEIANRTIYVDADNTGLPKDGTSWDTAFERLQNAIDDIKPIVNNCTITIYARGVFDEGDGWDEPTALVKRVCLGAGKITLAAEDYLDATTASGGSNNTITYAGTVDADYWNGGFVWIYTGTGKGQIREILDTSSTGGATTITTTVNWTINPDVTAKFCVASKASITQGAGTNYYGIQIQGGSTKFELQGFVMEDFVADDESYAAEIFSATVTMTACIAANNTPDASVDFFIGAYANFRADRCASLNNVSTGFYVTDAKATIFQCVIVNPGVTGVGASYASNAQLWLTNYSGGVNSIKAENNATTYINSAYGTDGSSYGIRAETGAQVETTGTIELSESADAASFGYIQ